MSLYTSTNIQIIDKIYLEIYQSSLVKEYEILLQINRYSKTTCQYTNRPWKTVAVIIALFTDNFNIFIQKKNQKKCICFNPPFSTNVKTNIGKILFKLLRKHFPKTNKLHKIFNKNAVKISYSWVRNMGLILAHSHRLLTPNNSSFGCNCITKSNCPLKETCLTPKMIYQADVRNDVDDEYKFYYSLTESSFKERFGNHTKSFNHRRYQNKTESSKFYLKIEI